MVDFAWTPWLKGLIQAAIGGVSGTVGTVFAIAYQTGGLPDWGAIGIAALVGSITMVLKFLSEKPLPEEESK